MTRLVVLMGLGLLLVTSTYAQQPNEPRFTGKSVRKCAPRLSSRASAARAISRAT